MTDCIFCKIIAGEIPSEKVYEDEHVYAFLDIKPVNPGHVLLIPKAHYADLFEMPDETIELMAKILKKLAQAVKTSLQPDGINIGMNNGSAAGQLIFHAHMHIMPRLKTDQYEMWHGEPYKEGEMKATGEKIRQAL
jgi:histidine triad (HIT) family protein